MNTNALYAMSLNMPDPHASVPGTTKTYDAAHPCCSNAPNVRGCEVVVTVPNKSRSQVYQMWLSSFDQADQRSVLFRRIRGGAMWTNLGTMVAGTFEARPKGGTTGEVGFKSIVYGRSVGEETIDDLKKDSFVKSSFLTNTNTCAYICSDDSGPLLWTSEAIFEDDDKASGVATKVTLKLRFKPKGCIVCPNEETGSNIPLWCLCPFVCIQMAIMIPCVYLCNASHFEAGYSQQRAMIQRRVNAIKAGILKGFTNPPNASFFPSIGNMFGGLPGMMNGMMGASAQQHHMQRMQQGGNLFGGNAMHMQQMQQLQQMNGMQTNQQVQMNQVPVATATAIPVVQTATAVPVETTPENSSAPPKSDM